MASMRPDESETKHFAMDDVAAVAAEDGIIVNNDHDIKDMTRLGKKQVSFRDIRQYSNMHHPMS